MPFIIIIGQPSAGKTTVANKIKEYFDAKGKLVEIVSETEILKQKNLTRNVVYSDSKIEKEVRGIIKTEVLRKMGPNILLILDGLNYIKGLRYEIYCASKTSKTTTCTVHVEPGPKTAWEYNLSKSEEEQYSREVFDGLVQRYEEPDSRNRWDSPMVTVVDNNKIAFEEIEAALYDRKPPPPNQSTQCQPLSDTNFLHMVDKATQSIVTDIRSANQMNLEGEITVTGTTEKFIRSNEKNTSLPQLMRYKRQFIVYIKSHPEITIDKVPLFFVQYLNTNL